MPEYTVRDAELQIKELRKRLDQISSSNWDRHGLRLINCGRSLDRADYVIREEVDSLISSAIDDIDLNPIVNSLVSGSGLQNPLIESILASQDNKYDIGESGANPRIRNIYSYLTNSETLEITDATHTSNWKVQQDSADVSILYLRGPSNDILFEFDSGPSFANVNTCYGSLFPDVDWNSVSPFARSLGQVGGNIWLQIIGWQLLAGKSGGAGTVSIHDGSSTYKDITVNGDGFNFEDSLVPSIASTHDLGTVSKPWDTLYVNNISGASFLTNPLTSSLLVANDGVYDLGQSGSNPRFRTAYTELVNTVSLEITNPSVHGSHWKFVQDAMDSSELFIQSPGSVDFVEFDAGPSKANVTTLHSHLEPDVDYNSGAPIGRFIGGVSGNIYLRIQGQQFLAGKGSVQGILSIYNSSAASPFSVRGVRKDGENAIEVQGNNSIDMANGNFYNRVYSGGDVNCASVSDGWMGFRSDTNELQICVGGSVVKVTLS